MSLHTWSDTEKKIARRIYDQALAAELAHTLAEFKSKAAALTRVEEMWELERYLRDRRRDIDNKYDFRYSQLLHVFRWLVNDGWLRASDLQGLRQEKIDAILVRFDD